MIFFYKKGEILGNILNVVFIWVKFIGYLMVERFNFKVFKKFWIKYYVNFVIFINKYKIC